METYNLINANIITLYDKFPTASSLIISNGKILSINEVNNKYIRLLNKISYNISLHYNTTFYKLYLW